MTDWITVFGSARPRPGEPAYEESFRLGRTLGEHGFGIINGGYGGTMEAAARGAREAGAPVRAVTLRQFGIGNSFSSETRVTETIFERLEKLLGESRAAIVLPGGTGTLLELATVLELNGKMLIGRAVPLIVVGDFWRPTIENVLPEMNLNREDPLPSRPPSTALEHLHFCQDVDAVRTILRNLPRSQG